MIALSFSGGKDSCLALYELEEQGKDVCCLFTTVWKESKTTVAHDETISQVEEQANRLQIPVHFIYTSSATYPSDFTKALQELKETYNLTGVAFGDWYLEGHRKWGEERAHEVQLQSHYPLWTNQSKMIEKLRYFVDLGFQAQIIKIDEEKLPADWLGRLIDRSFIDDIQKYDVCPMGESGEYHTSVKEGPIFEKDRLRA